MAGNDAAAARPLSLTTQWVVLISICPFYQQKCAHDAVKLSHFPPNLLDSAHLSDINDSSPGSPTSFNERWLTANLTAFLFTYLSTVCTCHHIIFHYYHCYNLSLEVIILSPLCWSLFSVKNLQKIVQQYEQFHFMTARYYALWWLKLRLVFLRATNNVIHIYQDMTALIIHPEQYSASFWEWLIWCLHLVEHRISKEHRCLLFIRRQWDKASAAVKKRTLAWKELSSWNGANL